MGTEGEGSKGKGRVNGKESRGRGGEKERGERKLVSPRCLF